MKYTHNEVIDIIKITKENSIQNPEEILNLWLDKKSNTKLEIGQNNSYKYGNYVYSFPMIIENKEVATITRVYLYNDLDVKDELMIKYFGRKNFNESWESFSHDTYLSCYLTIHEEFKLPEIVKGFFANTLQVVDANNTPFEVKVSYGYPENENENENDIHEEWASDKNSYRFDNDVNIKIEAKPKGWALGEKINENIDKRLIPIKREEKINQLGINQN